jgi:hypothetical protein
MLKLILKEWNGEAWTELFWVRIGTIDGPWRVREFNFGFSKLWGISWLLRNFRFSVRTVLYGDI